MLSFINRLVRDFERDHGVHPNLLYLNRFHAEHLKSSFDEDFSMTTILNVLGMELIIENDITQPHVAWTQAARRVSAY